MYSFTLKTLGQSVKVNCLPLPPYPNKILVVLMSEAAEHT
jgi:hypothetical protein